jgi:hypothetical protein
LSVAWAPNQNEDDAKPETNRRIAARLKPHVMIKKQRKKSDQNELQKQSPDEWSRIRIIEERHE